MNDGKSTQPDRLKTIRLYPKKIMKIMNCEKCRYPQSCDSCGFCIKDQEAILEAQIKIKGKLTQEELHQKRKLEQLKNN